MHVPNFDPGMLLGFQEVLVLKTKDETMTVFWYSPEECSGGKVPSHGAVTWFLLQRVLEHVVGVGPVLTPAGMRPESLWAPCVLLMIRQSVGSVCRAMLRQNRLNDSNVDAMP